MANLTIALAEGVLKSARRRAQEQGTSVNAVLRTHLQHFAGSGSLQVAAAAEVLKLARSFRAGNGGQRWTREELHG